MDEELIERKIFHTYVNNEKIYVKKDMLGWHVVYPNKNEDGSWNWKNLIAGGSWIKLVGVIIFTILCIGAIFEVRHFIDVGNACMQSIQTNPLELLK